MSLAGTRGPIAGWREAQLRKIFDTGDTLRLQFPREDLGFQYARGAVCPHADDVPASGAQAPSSSPRNRSSEYVPSTAPGFRLPHVELRLEDALTASTVDMAARLAAAQLMLVVSDDHGSPVPSSLWQDATASLAAQGAQLSILVIRQQPAHASSTAGAAGALIQEGTLPADSKPSNGKPVQMVGLDVAGRWPEVREVNATGAILVRPDGHVAWRSMGAPATLAAGCKALQDARQSVFRAP